MPVQLAKFFQGFELEYLLGSEFGYYVYSTLIYQMVCTDPDPHYANADPDAAHHADHRPDARRRRGQLHAASGLAGVSAVLSPILVSLFAYAIVRTRWRGRTVLDGIISTSAALPGIMTVAQNVAFALEAKHMLRNKIRPKSRRPSPWSA